MKSYHQIMESWTSQKQFNASVDAWQPAYTKNGATLIIVGADPIEGHEAWQVVAYIPGEGGERVRYEQPARTILQMLEEDMKYLYHEHTPGGDKYKAHFSLWHLGTMWEREQQSLCDSATANMISRPLAFGL